MKLSRCPTCGAEGAEILFSLARCVSDTCRLFDPQHAARVAEEERQRADGRRWYADRATYGPDGPF